MHHIPEDCNININTQIWSTQTVNMQLQRAKLLTALNVNTRVSNTMHQTIWKQNPSDHKNLVGWCALKCIAHPQWPPEPSGMMSNKMYGTTSHVTTRAFWDDAHQNVQHNILSDHKSLLGWCEPKCMAQHPLWPQEPSEMMGSKMYDTTFSVTTRTYWEDVHQNVWHNILSDHKNLQRWCTPKCMAQHYQWPQEPTEMMCTKMYDTTSPVTTRTFRHAAHNTI